MDKINKRADEKLFSIWWFVSLTLVGVTVTVVVLNYFSSSIDVRAKEVSMLEQKILDCIIKKGYLKKEVLSWKNEEIFDKCGLNKESFKEETNTKIFFNLKLKNEKGEEIKVFRFGEVSYEEECLIKQKGSYFPACSKTKSFINLINDENKKETIIIDLLVASQNHGTKKGFTKLKT